MSFDIIDCSLFKVKYLADNKKGECDANVIALSMQDVIDYFRNMDGLNLITVIEAIDNDLIIIDPKTKTGEDSGKFLEDR